METLILNVKVGPYIDIMDAAKEAHRIARKIGVTITFDFYGKAYYVNPDTTMEEFLIEWTESQQ